MKAFDPVAIVGIGCISAAGDTLAACMDSLYRGVRNPAAPVRTAVDLQFLMPVFQIRPDFFPAHRFHQQHGLRTCQLALTAALEAIDDAGLDRERLKRCRTGVCLGTNVGSSMNNETFYRDRPEGCDPYIPPSQRFLISNPTVSIAEEFGTSGPCQTVVNACSAGSDAIGLAASWIRSGLCDLVITGGADEFYRVTYAGFKSLLIQDDTPCKPFDAHRAGLNLGEGAAIFILADPDRARELDLRPRAAVAGYGSATDAYHFTRPRPDGIGLKAAVLEAVQTSGVALEQIAFVNAHGTGTIDNDRVEARVLSDLLAATPFLSTKGGTGHTLGASGAIEAAFSIACLEAGRIPASIGFSTPDPALPAHPVRRNTALNGRPFAMSQTLAFGGHNAVLILGKGETCG